jgi:REP element-mobilizing transposase RayT
MIMLVPLERLDPKDRVLHLKNLLAAVYREKPLDVNWEAHVEHIHAIVALHDS